MERRAASSIACGWAAWLVTASALVACAAPEPPDTVGATEVPVANGSIDTADAYRAVVSIGPNCDTFAPACSGTLVTPTRVMTAQHCTGPTGSQLNLCVVSHPGGVKTAAQYSGVVTKRFPYDGGDRGLDIAVVDLNVPIFNVPFIPVADADDPCPEEFTGTLVGYGAVGAQPPQCGQVDHEDRSYASSDEWTLETTALAGTFENTWNLTGYEGGLFHDSGGALIRSGRLCGVHSGHTGAPCVPLFGAVAALSIAAAPQKLGLGVSAQGLMPEQGVSYTDPRTGEKAAIGTCPPSYFSLSGADPALAQVDLDGDDMPDLCDTCPNLKNPEQFVEVEPDADDDQIPDRCDKCSGVATPAPLGVAQRLAPLFPQPDADADGRADVCDWCTGVPAYSQELQDCNLEAELAEFYPGSTAPPIVKLGPSYAADLAKYQAAFKIGTCEPAPCPVIKLVEEGAFPPGQATTTLCIPPAPGICQFKVRNYLAHTPKPSPATDGGVGGTHTKWCDCPGGDVETPEGRAACQITHGCRGVASTFDSVQWHEIRAGIILPGGAVNWAGAGPDAFLQLFNGQLRIRTLWDYRNLGQPFVRNRATGQPFVEGVDDPIFAFVNGALWQTTRNGFGYPSGSLQEQSLRQRGNIYETGQAEVQKKVKLFLNVPVKFVWDLHYPCKDCPFSASNLLIDPTLAVNGKVVPVLVSPEGAAASPAAASSGFIDALLETQSQSQRVVAVGEPLGVLEAQSGTGSALRGLILDADGTPDKLLFAQSLHGPIAAAPIDRTSGATLVVNDTGSGDGDTIKIAAPTQAAADSGQPGPLRPDEGLVASGGRLELFRFGGEGKAEPELAWVYRLRFGQWIPTILSPGARPGRVVAATFNATDDRVYELDRGASGQKLHLRRWDPGSTRFESVAIFSAAWSGLDRRWLVTNDAGALIHVASGKALTVIAWLELGPQGTLAFRGLKVIHEEVLDRPFASREGIALTVGVPGADPLAPAGGVRQVIVRASELKEQPKAWQPEMP